MLVKVLMQIRQFLSAAQGRYFVNADSRYNDEFPRGQTLLLTETIVELVECFLRDLLALCRDAFFTRCHLLPFLIADCGDSVVADVERAGD